MSHPFPPHECGGEGVGQARGRERDKSGTQLKGQAPGGKGQVRDNAENSAQAERDKQGTEFKEQGPRAKGQAGDSVEKQHPKAKAQVAYNAEKQHPRDTK